MFTDYPTYSRYRTLGLAQGSAPLQRGEDVYALQLALKECGVDPGTPDGILGTKTAQAIRAVQTHLFLTVDGLAGGATQRALALHIATGVAAQSEIPISGLQGQLEHESGYRLGNYSPLRDDDTYDAGVAQRNTKYTDPKLGFDPADSIGALGRNTRKYFDLFAGMGPVKRRWALAQGAWNAPAFACYLAREEGGANVKLVTPGMVRQPTKEQRATFEQYVADVTLYLKV